MLSAMDRTSTVGQGFNCMTFNGWGFPRETEQCGAPLSLLGIENDTRHTKGSPHRPRRYRKRYPTINVALSSPSWVSKTIPTPKIGVDRTRTYGALWDWIGRSEIK